MERPRISLIWIANIPSRIHPKSMDENYLRAAHFNQHALQINS
jgi:hypothetical protein